MARSYLRGYPAPRGNVSCLRTGNEVCRAKRESGAVKAATAGEGGGRFSLLSSSVLREEVNCGIRGMLYIAGDCSAFHMLCT